FDRCDRIIEFAVPQNHPGTGPFHRPTSGVDIPLTVWRELAQLDVIISTRLLDAPSPGCTGGSGWARSDETLVRGIGGHHRGRHEVMEARCAASGLAAALRRGSVQLRRR